MEPVKSMSVQFDDIPIPAIKNNANHFDVPEFIPQQSNNQTAINLTLDQKLASKTIKIKLEALQQLHELLQRQVSGQQKQSDLEAIEAISMPKILKQNNPACIEKSLSCMMQWMALNRNWGTQQIKSVIQCGFINGKGNAKKHAIQVIEKMFETKQNEVQGTIIEGLKSKTPKIIGGYLGIMNQLLDIFGIKSLKYLKPYIGDIVRVMNSEKLPAVKNQGMNLLKSGYKWVGKDFFTQYIKNLKENIQKQLDNFWETCDKSEKMVSKKQANLNTQLNPQPNTQSSQQPQSDKIDLFDISEPVDALRDFDEKWTDSVLYAEKWNIKVQLLQNCQSKTDVPKIQTREIRHIVEMCRRLLSDSNFNVVLNTLRLIGNLAKGLRRAFTHSTKILMPLILPKFRDKKTQMIEQTFSTLNSFYYSISLEEIIEDIKSGLKDKTPSAKQHLLDWVTQFVTRKYSEDGKLNDKLIDALNSINDMIEKLLSDPSSEVRDSVVKYIGFLNDNVAEVTVNNLDKSQNKNLESKIQDSSVSRIDNRSKSKNNKTSKKSQSKSKMENSISKCTEAIISEPTVPDFINDLPLILKKLNDSSNWENRKQMAEQISQKFQQLSITQAKLPSTSIVHDFLAVIKTRIADPNKQLIKIFISLIAKTFLVLNEKQAKIQYRPFIQSLVEALSDKNNSNKKEIFKTMDIIGEIVGQQTILSTVSQTIINQNNYRVYCLEYLLLWQQNLGSLSKQELKDFPKVIISCLCDKNREIKAKSQQILKLLCNKIPVEMFKTLIKDVKPAFKNQLTALTQKYYGITNSSIVNQSSFYSNKSINPKIPSRKCSPSISKCDASRSKYSNTKRSNSKIKNNFFEDSHSHLYQSNSGFKNTMSIVEGQYFAPLSTLSQERIERQEKEQRYRNNFASINFCEDNKANINRLMNQEELALKLLSQDYRQNLEGSATIIRICKDPSQQNAIREIYDVIFIWAASKLFGGSPALIQVFQVVSPILSILEKKKIAISQTDINIIFDIIREYVLSSSLVDSINYETLKSVMKICIALSSGQRLLRKILQEFKFDYSSIHRHIRKTYNSTYKSVLSFLCEAMSDYFSNGSVLQEASKIPELLYNEQFYAKLKEKFHENMLKEFGFSDEKVGQQFSESFGQQVRNSCISSRVGESRNLDRSKSRKKTPNHKPNPSTTSNNTKFSNIQEIPSWRESQQPNFSQVSSANYLKVNLSDKHQDFSNASLLQQIQNRRYLILESECDYEIDLDKYNSINSFSPLGNNLKKLYPPSDNVINFFSTLLQENSEKISQELVNNCNIIYGSIFNGLIKIMQNRDDFSPQRIIGYSHLVQQAIKCANVFKKIDEGLVAHSCQFVVNQLVYEDENRPHIQSKLQQQGYTDVKSDCFIKAINGIMLRILDNTPPLFVVTLLLEMLAANNTKKNLNNKKTGLLIRCINRVASSYFNPQSFTYSYEKDKGDKMVITFFAITKQYLDVMGIMSLVNHYKKYGPNIEKNSKSQESIVQGICNILHVICKQSSRDQGSDKVWSLYSQFKSDLLSIRQQILIKQFIEYVIGPEKALVNNSSQCNNSSKKEKTNHNRQQSELKQIIELLAKSRTFQQGISYLKQFLGKNKNFNLDQYFINMNFDRGFITKVKQQLKATSHHSYKNNLNPDIQNKLENLKKKLQVMQVKTPLEVSSSNRQKSSHFVDSKNRGENITPKNKRQREYSNNAQVHTQYHKQDNHKDVKKRIEDMKSKINLASTNRMR